MAANIHSDDGDLSFQIAPMVDIVFVLMLFFMACGFQAKEFAVNAAIPAPFNPGTPVISIDVTIASSGDVYLQDQLIAGAEDRKIAALIEWLNHSRERFGEGDPVEISPAPTVNHERVMDVLKAVNEAKWTKVTLR
jgi:biopolymer transport protein ExbD